MGEELNPVVLIIGNIIICIVIGIGIAFFTK